MLTAADLQLITAVVDGEATPADTRRFNTLVAAKAEAAAVAASLRSDALALRRLPKRRAPEGTTAAVMARLPRVAAPIRRRPRTPVWLPYAVAASLLLTVTAGSYWYFAGKQDRELLASKTRLVLPISPNAPSVPIPEKTQPEPEQGSNLAQVPDELPFPREVIVAAPKPRDLAPMPRSFAGDLVGAGISERAKPLQTVELKLPLIAGVSEFGRDETRARFAAEFARDPAVRIDIFAKNLPTAIEIVTAATRTAGVTVTADAASQDLIAKKVPAAYAYFIEGLTPTELARLLEAVATQVATHPQPPISTVHAFTAGNHEQKEWKDLFGRDLGLFRSANPESTALTRPISEGTIGKLRGAVGKNPEKAGLLLTYLPFNGRSNPTMSKEIKAFLDGRGERKAGTLPAFIVVRPAH